MSFCTRQAVISDTRISLGLRQSISWTVLNSPSSLPGLAELADDGPVQFHLVDLAGDGRMIPAVLLSGLELEL